MQVKDLEPKEIWENFANLNAVPRPSKKEERVIQFMVEFGKKLGLETHTDKIGNIIIKKPATKGMENRPTLILQSHVDMVHQKNNDTVFDFDNQGIDMYVDGDWVKAKGTTLGADNGIGVATIMGLLASKDIPHPALEGMFTVDEETGMTGAKELDPSFYDGKILLNLDTEDDDELSIGCAGGVDTNTSYDYEELYSIEDVETYKVDLKGLKGGHSGMDIDKGRANANKLLTRFLYESDLDIMLHSFEGGSLRNAIPREASAVVSVWSHEVEKFENYIAECKSIYEQDYKAAENNISFQVSKTDLPDKMIAGNEREQIIRVLYALHNGVFKMSLKFEGLVEASSSLAKVTIKDGSFETQSLQRSSRESSKKDVANTIKSAFELLGPKMKVEQSGDYPGWEPNPDSPILKLMKEIYQEKFGEAPKVLAGHGGLECGLLGDKLPDVDMISFGPTINHPHSPDECVQISSVQKFWDYLLEVIKRVK